MQIYAILVLKIIFKFTHFQIFKLMTIDLQYLPSLEYFCAILNKNEFNLEAHEYFEKQSYRNRCRIQTTNKIDTLSVPVLNGNKKILIRDLKIDYSQDWTRRHWGAIHSAYGKAPFFEFYSEFFKNIFDKMYKNKRRHSLFINNSLNGVF